MYYIIQALVKSNPRKGIFEIEFKTKEGFVKTYRLRFSQKTLPKLIQIKVYFVDDLVQVQRVIPTFFDFPSRCKKCGRFYKIYCKNCHQKLEWTYMILNKFVEENKPTRNYNVYGEPAVKEALDRFAEESKEKIEKIVTECEDIKFFEIGTDPAPAGPEKE